MLRNRFLILTALILLGLGFGLWWMRRGKAEDPLATSKPGSGHVWAKGEEPHDAGEAKVQPTRRTPLRKDPGRQEQQDLEKISDLLSDSAKSPEEAAVELWKMAADPNRDHDVRREALQHALNLTEDVQYARDVLSLLAKPGVWVDDLGESIVDDLYNRDDAIKLRGVVVFFPQAQGEARTSARELLSFLVGDPESVTDEELLRLGQQKLREGGN